MQNFVYKGDADPTKRRKDQELVARLARRLRDAASLSRRDGAS